MAVLEFLHEIDMWCFYSRVNVRDARCMVKMYRKELHNTYSWSILYEDNLASDKSKVDYANGNLGPTNLQSLDGLPICL